MTDMSEFDKIWKGDSVEYDIRGTLLYSVSPECMLLVSMDRFQSEGAAHSIILSDAAIIEKLLNSVSAKTGGFEFSPLVEMTALVERNPGKVSFRFKKVIKVTILEGVPMPTIYKF